MKTMADFTQKVLDYLVDGEDFIGVYIKLPDLEEPELIINPRGNWSKKLAYYQNTYNAELQHDRVPGLQLLDVVSFKLENDEDL